MAPTNSHVKLAESLPPLLLRFFTRYQPQRPASSAIVSSTNQSSSSNTKTSPIQNFLEPSALPNPFRSQKSPVTGLWQDPIYSLRRQAVLVKLARAHGVEELLPHTVKGTEVRTQKRVEHGLRVKGTGIGQRVKGKGWERTQKGRLNQRKEAMLKMPQMIHDWKQVSWTGHFGAMGLTDECREGMDVAGRNGPNDRVRIPLICKGAMSIFRILLIAGHHQRLLVHSEGVFGSIDFRTAILREAFVQNTDLYHPRPATAKCCTMTKRITILCHMAEFISKEKAMYPMRRCRSMNETAFPSNMNLKNKYINNPV